MPSVGVRTLLLERLGCVTEVESFPFRGAFSAARAAASAVNCEKIRSIAAADGSSGFFAPGVLVRDLDRLVDFPKEPVSGTILRRDVDAPSGLLKMSKLILSMI